MSSIHPARIQHVAKRSNSFERDSEFDETAARTHAAGARMRSCAQTAESQVITMPRQLSRLPSRTHALAGLTAAAGIGWLYRVMAIGLPELTVSIVDDGFYYLSIARGFWKYGAFTYDGTSDCYGFQPLWAIALIPFGALPLTSGALLRLALALGVLLFCAAGVFLCISIQRYFSDSFIGILVAVLWLTSIDMAGALPFSLKENTLLATLVLGFGCATSSLGTASRSRLAAVGLVLGLIPVCRFNAFIFMAMAILWIHPFWKTSDSVSTWRGWALATLVSIGVCGSWYLYAYLHFGTPMPYSGHMKVELMKQLKMPELGGWFTWRHLHLSVAYTIQVCANLWRSWFGHYWVTYYLPALILLIPALPAALGRDAWERFRPFARWMALLCVYGLSCTWLNCFAIPDLDSLKYFHWYFVAEALIPFYVFGFTYHMLASCRSRLGRITRPQMLAGVAYMAFQIVAWIGGLAASAPVSALVMGCLLLWLGNLSGTTKRRRLSECTLIVMFIASSPSIGHIFNTTHELLPAESYQCRALISGLVLGERLPEGTVIAASDSGIFGYFSGLPIVNLEGLMADREYQQVALHSHERRPEYLRARAVKYVFGSCAEGPPGVFSQMYLGRSVSAVPIWSPFHGSRDESFLEWPMILLRPVWASPVVDETSIASAFGSINVDGKWTTRARFLGSDGQIYSHETNDGIEVNFESGTYKGWVCSGDAFGERPSRSTGTGGEHAAGIEGESFADSYAANSDEGVGRLVSRSFRLDADLICARVGGGKDPNNLALRIFCDSHLVQSFTGDQSDVLKQAIVDVSQHRGKTAWLEIVDNSRGPWGHILIDDINFLDTSDPHSGP